MIAVAYIFYRRCIAAKVKSITIDQLIDLIVICKTQIEFNLIPKQIPRSYIPAFRKRLIERYPGVWLHVFSNCVVVRSYHHRSLILEINDWG